MNHEVVLPVVLPLSAAVLCLALHGAGLRVQRGVSLASAAALLVLAVHLLAAAGRGEIEVYRLGDWPPPFGIVLVLDRLAAIMLGVTAALGLPVLMHAAAGADANGRHFHALFQLQLAGLNGAFLTGDIFNLFVFFEVLLLASYGLLVHGGRRERSRAGLVYVVLNLAGSALFVGALGLFYGVLGTLNLADIAVVLPQLPPASQALARTAGALLILVFVLKAALLPLTFWLPHAYVAAAAPVAALFAVMTKVGIYAVLRVSAIGFAGAPATADLLQPWLTPLALATIALGTVGALAATRFMVVVANLVIVSSGTLLAAVAALERDASAAALFYLVHSTLVTAALFLLGDWIGRSRGDLGDVLERGPRLQNLGAIGAVYLLLSLAVSGMPPLSGFVGKVMLLESLQFTPLGAVFWVALLLSSLLVALVLARSASTLLWEPGRPGPGPADPAAPADRPVALFVLALASPLLVAAASEVSDYTRAAAAQLHDGRSYVEAVLGEGGAIARELRP
jgi:multicomponent K+:H+ antiporter subunit D